MKWKEWDRRWIILLIVAGATLRAGGCNHDRVLFSNTNGSGEIGILLDGQVNGNAVNDTNYTTSASSHVDPGTVTAGVHNEVIAYQQKRPVAVSENTGWTANNDTIRVSFGNEMGTRFYVWLLQDPFADRYTQAIAACIKLDEIWEDERMGTQIATFQVTDKTSDSARNPFLDFTCSEASDLRSNIGYNSNGINIYYVSRVDFGNGFATSNGVWCGNNTVVMGSNASDHLAAHEVGHAFALAHVNNLTTNFNTINVMHNASNNREYLTEGQTIRAHLEPNSVINTTYNLRSGLPTRDCSDLSETATDECPAIQKRIWADGSFSPN